MRPLKPPGTRIKVKSAEFLIKRTHQTPTTTRDMIGVINGRIFVVKKPPRDGWAKIYYYIKEESPGLSSGYWLHPDWVDVVGDDCLSEILYEI